MIEQTYKKFLALTGEPTAAALLTLADAIQKTPERGLLKVKEAAAALGVSPATIYDLCDSGRLRHQRIGRAIRIKESDLTDYKSDNESGGHKLRFL